MSLYEEERKLDREYLESFDKIRKIQEDYRRGILIIATAELVILGVLALVIALGYSSSLPRYFT